MAGLPAGGFQLSNEGRDRFCAGRGADLDLHTTIAASVMYWLFLSAVLDFGFVQFFKLGERRGYYAPVQTLSHA